MGCEPWTYFSCPRLLACNWTEPVLALGGSVVRGHQPEIGTDTSEWTQADWDVFSLGGYAQIDQDTACALNCYRLPGTDALSTGMDLEITCSALADFRMILMFASAGAHSFSSTRIFSGQSQYCRLGRVSVAEAVGWDVIPSFRGHRVSRKWPQTTIGERGVRLPFGYIECDSCVVDVIAGMTLDPKSFDLAGYIYAQVRATTRGCRLTSEEVDVLLHPLFSHSTPCDTSFSQFRGPDKGCVLNPVK